MSIEDVVNQALDQLGYPRHIGNIYEGSPAARVALDVWQQTRNSLFTRVRPDWAKKDAVLTLSKSAPNIAGGTAAYDLTPWSTTYPPLPWLYEYRSPSDCLYPLQIKTRQFFLPIWRPRAITFRHAENTILTNAPNAILTYVYAVLDPDLWESDFTDLMVQMLAQKMQAEFAKGTPMKEEKDGNPS
jgi:hypothetical protein